jgi:hypothetical protein
VNILDTNNIKTELRASSIHVGDSTIFAYRPMIILPSVTFTTVPIPILPYQEFLLINTGTTAITYLVGGGSTPYNISYNGNSYNRVTLNKQGQNLTLGIPNGATTYFVIQISGTVNVSNINFFNG